MIDGAKELVEDHYGFPINKLKTQNRKKPLSVGASFLIDKYFPSEGTQ